MHQNVLIRLRKLCIMPLLGAILYNEYLAYFLNYAGWPSMSAQNLAGNKNDSEDSLGNILRILFIADAQIQGMLHEASWGTITRWDSDLYLKKTFGWAMYAYAPQLVVFLGDLLDEGSEADDEQYLEYVMRFKNIYALVEDKR